MKKLLIYLIPVLAFCLLNITSCKDEAEELPRLFRPSFIASSCFAEGNSITLAWRTSGEATSYTVELSRDQTTVNALLQVCVMKQVIMPV